ncbi:hypothetical protein OsI_03829 [Oryza sativa Indica Group]|uniref:Uncharacterized protein n=1 Tax=Oryza sativa subsp. indica TaxID=39946 RepID=A2WVB3_ORYSI|nr:hypothetical protein OsI_03829 [Oryza sativa Indica Group]
MSMGGLINKMTGRIGDSPLIGSGEGKAIIRSTLARDVAAVMEYRGAGLQEAIDYCVKERLDKGFIGLLAVSGTGEVAHGFNCTGMFSGEGGLYAMRRIAARTAAVIGVPVGPAWAS